jgi:DNA-binding beta-propeller fold protein YncE
VQRSPPSAPADTLPVDERLSGPGRPEPSLPRRALVGAFAFALAAAGIAFAARALRPDNSPKAETTLSPSVETSPVPPLTGDPRITAEISLVDDQRNGGTGGVAVGAGSAWVGIQRGGAGFVVRIDLATNEVVAEIPVQETPWRKRIDATDEAVWVASHGVLERIDPDTNTVVASVDLRGRPISAIAADSTAVWAVAITRPSDEAGEWTGNLVRVDTATNEAVAEIPLGPQVAGYEDEVMVGAGSVWVLGVRWFEKEDAEYGSDLIRVDPATNGIVARIPVGGFHMVMGADEVWVRFIADGVFDTYGERGLWTRVDLRTSEQSQPFELGTDGLRIVTPDALWSVGYDDEQHNVRVSSLDPQTLEVEARSDPIRSLFTDAVLDPASRTVWVSAIYSVVRLDIVPDAEDRSPSSFPVTYREG